MHRLTRVFPVVLVLSAALLPLTHELAARSSGSPGGYSGAPGHQTCVVCHNSFPLNSGSARFALSTSPTLVGRTNLPVQVSFASSGGVQHGFELALRDAAVQASGRWTITDPSNTQTVGSGVTHTSNGSARRSWNATWTPPASMPAGPLTFYAAGVEGNGGNGNSGDHVYTDRFTVYQAELTTPNATWPLGTTQPFALQAPTRPGDFYVLAISDRTTPTPLGGPMVLPVDIGSPLFDLVLLGVPFFQNFIGTLDGAGRAQASIFLPNLPFLSGFTWHFAFATLDPRANVTEVSNRVSARLQ